jgi:uncharacterized damage-inducible protein DinB
MSIADSLLAEFNQECETTRRFLERLPKDKLSWRPHPKSMSAGQLALHIAASPGNVIKMAVEDTIPMPDFSKPQPEPKSVQEVLDALDDAIATVKDTLPTIDDAQMFETWTVKNGDDEVMAMPRIGVLRSIMLNHLYHHRGQFGVYLRLLGAKVPSSYGPSGDELPAFLKETKAAVR